MRITEPGKFEGEEDYVPYFWGLALEGIGEDDGKMLSVLVEAEDKEKFPALKRRRVVKMWEDDQGFVREVR